MVILLTLLLSCFCAAVMQAQIVKTGADNLIDTDFALLRGKRVVLVSHAAARVYTGRTTAEEMQRASNISLLRILTPEHGFYGIVRAGERVNNDVFHGTPLISLYGANRRPMKSQIEDADVVVVDLQDIGTRSYTYVSTMTEVMEACAQYNIPIVILDRPNPLGGLMIDGTLPDTNKTSFVCRIPIPYVHGMTLGELASMINGMGWLSKTTSGKSQTCSLSVVRLKRWTRDMTWEQSGLPWYPTSPNIPTLAAVRGYPVTGLLGELGGASIGIGSTMPFMVVGGPTVHTDSVLITRLASCGVHALPCQFMPTVGAYANTVCNGYQITYQPQPGTKPFIAAMAIITSLRDSKDIVISGRSKEMFSKVCGTTDLFGLLSTGASWNDIKARAGKLVREFTITRAPYLLY